MSITTNPLTPGTHHRGDRVTVSRTVFKMGVGPNRGWQTMPRPGIEGVIIGTRTIPKLLGSVGPVTVYLVEYDDGRKTLLALPEHTALIPSPYDDDGSCWRCERPVIRRSSFGEDYFIHDEDDQVGCTTEALAETVAKIRAGQAAFSSEA